MRMAALLRESVSREREREKGSQCHRRVRGESLLTRNHVGRVEVIGRVVLVLPKGPILAQ